MNGRKTFRTRKLSFEGLERRAMLASVSFSGGILFITGDDTPETVDVTEVTPGTLTVAGTGIAVPVTQSGVVGIVADMKGGDDELNIGTGENPVDLPGPVSIRLGNGSDETTLFLNTPSSVSVDGGFQSGTAAQDDDVLVVGSNIGVLIVNTYAGDDSLTSVGSTFTTLAVNLGVGALGLGQVDADNFTMVGGGATVAAINLGTSQAAEGNSATIVGSIFSTLAINGGEGADAVTLVGATATSAIAINTFGGADSITLVGVTATNSLSISAGAGTDNVVLVGVTTAFAFLDGGSGIDSLADDNSPGIVARVKLGWENDDPVL
jgi:hypothetical protein